MFDRYVRITWQHRIPCRASACGGGAGVCIRPPPHLASIVWSPGATGAIVPTQTVAALAHFGGIAARTGTNTHSHFLGYFRRELFRDRPCRDGKRRRGHVGATQAGRCLVCRVSREKRDCLSSPLSLGKTESRKKICVPLEKKKKKTFKEGKCVSTRCVKSGISTLHR